MNIFIPKDNKSEETRIAVIPETVKKLNSLGVSVTVEKGIGARLGIEDESYTRNGALVLLDRNLGFSSANLILCLNTPSDEDMKQLKERTILIGFLDPFFSKDAVQQLARLKVNAIAMELVPRSTVAQKMDALSSQANLAGYYAVLLGASKMGKILPMMMTPAGTLSPARVFVIGAGVAGLQAIATAKRLGARVEAFDTRPVVAEQVESLGAKFLRVDLGETGQTAGGYAQALTEEQLEKQRAAMAKACAQADLVVTTAQLLGRKAPRIITREMVEKMSPGSVIVDLAADSGGNVEGSSVEGDVVVGGVTIVSGANLSRKVPIDASRMYSNNLGNLIEHFWDKTEKLFRLDLNDPIIHGCLVTHDGEIVNQLLIEAYR